MKRVVDTSKVIIEKMIIINERDRARTPAANQLIDYSTNNEVSSILSPITI